MSGWHAGIPFDQTPSALHSPAQTTPSVLNSPSEEISSRKRKHSAIAENGITDHSNHEHGSPASPTAHAAKSRQQPGVKRACNDCRQQKLRCNVIAGPGSYYKPCDRCVKHKLPCSIDNDFKRLGKRAAHEEMVRELDRCRTRLAEYEALGISLPTPINTDGSVQKPYDATDPSLGQPATNGLLAANEAAASRSLLDLSQGYREMPPTLFPSITPGSTARVIRNVTLTDEEVKALYATYFTSFHQFLPLLNPDLDHEAYYALHPLLHWTIIAVAARRYDPKPGLLVELQRPLEEMLWTTLSHNPQVYHVCKALALLCTWPMPNSSTSTEPTMMLVGVMFQLAMQYGLHRPSHAQDFSRFRIDLREEDIADRLNTWAAVNIVAQSVATGQGQPPLSRWAWYTYGLHLNSMKPELHARCQIEKFCDTVTRTIYTMQRDHIVEVDMAQKGLQVDMYARELGELEVTLMSSRPNKAHTGGSSSASTAPAFDAALPNSINILYLKAAALHLRLSVFFDKPTSPNYNADLRNVYIAASSFLTVLIDFPDGALLFVPRHIEQMMLAAAVTLLRLLSSFYAAHIDVIASRTLFSRTVDALRRLSIRSNDLPQRLAEVMAQLWQSSQIAQQTSALGAGPARVKTGDEDLQLRVRCRSSLSVLFDVIWRWRQQVGPSGRENLDMAVANPTTVTAQSTPQPGAPVSDPLLAPSASITGGLGETELDMGWDGFGSNAVFDPLSWALDGNLHFGNQMFGVPDGLGFQV